MGERTCGGGGGGREGGGGGGGGGGGANDVIQNLCSHWIPRPKWSLDHSIFKTVYCDNQFLYSA